MFQLIKKISFLFFIFFLLFSCKPKFYKCRIYKENKFIEGISINATGETEAYEQCEEFIIEKGYNLNSINYKISFY